MALLPTSTLSSRLGAAAALSAPTSGGWQLAGTGFSVSGLAMPPPPPPTKVGSYAPTIPPPSPRQYYTAAPQGGPGATFGPPGVAGAPVPFIGSGGISIGGLTLTPGMLLILGAVAVGGYLVLR